jgi:hypothetical protein
MPNKAETTVTLSLPAELVAWIETTATKQSVSPAEVVRVILTGAQATDEMDLPDDWWLDALVMAADDDDPIWELQKVMAAREVAGLPATDDDAMGVLVGIMADGAALEDPTSLVGGQNPAASERKGDVR